MSSILVNFLVAVAAQITANYLCKWLDSHRKGETTTMELDAFIAKVTAEIRNRSL